MDEDRSFLGRVAVVTGASRAVGVGIATLLGFGGSYTLVGSAGEHQPLVIASVPMCLRDCCR